ncbi:hypothetical protein T8T21_09065 [Limimaricola variabilis]|uniref:hypothetical protein n=1 Tax=Limimaricola variabilis TaxID=1492771 RepID=UPI002AC8C04C|nr:hypothetical protein [Limimaricola variabilis]WPY93277.1 hypothetical protein T8T21_09065 [Limimaricola variabilis]
MFDFTHTEPARETFDLARTLFLDHGQDLANAARHLGGKAGESRVRSCALQLEAATRMNPRTRRDLVVIHRLLALENVGDPDCLESELFSNLHPGSAEVETICLLTELLEDLLYQIDRPLLAGKDPLAS